MPLTAGDITGNADLFRQAYPHWPSAEPDPHAECCLPLPQEQALRALCERYGVEYRAEHYRPTFDLPKTWVAGWVGGPARKLYVGCDPEGRISS